MTELSAVEIAKKQRYLHLLQKVKENKTLSKVELDELRRYERKMVGKVISSSRIRNLTQRAMRPTVQSAKRSTKPSKKGKKKILTAKRVRLPIEEAEIRRLGLECENLTEADVAIKKRKSLKEIFKKHPQLRQAWDRGRFLRNIRDLARTGISVSKAAKKLGLANGRVLRTMIDEDQEVGDLWDQTQLEFYIEIRSAIAEAAKEGKPAAIRALELLDEKERPGFDPSHITILQLTELTGKPRQTIHEWYTKFGLPRNADKTFDLSIFLAWYEEFVERKCGKKEIIGPLNPFQQVKTERERLRLEQDRGELTESGAVIGFQVAQMQNLVDTFKTITDLANRVFGQPREEIVARLEDFRDEVMAKLQHMPAELKLSPEASEKIVELYEIIKPQRND